MGKIFLSYSRKNSKIADSLDVMFQTKDIKLERDIRDIDYRESIKEFMKKVRNADFSLMIISEDYLKSPYCMYEVTEFIKDENYKEKILPIVQSDVDIFENKGRNKYIKYWQDKYKETYAELNDLDELNKGDTIDELKKIEEIQRKISEFMTFIAEIKNVVYKENISMSDFNQIYSVIDPQGEFWVADNEIEGYFMLNVPRTLRRNEMIWWERDNKGYTDDLKEARIFTLQEVERKMKEVNAVEKFAAIPVNKIAKDFGQSVIPRSDRFMNIIHNKRQFIIGNSHIYLDEERIGILI